MIEAGQNLFAARAVDGVSVDDIVALAQVAKGSFYNHFPDKEALAQAIAATARGEVEALAAKVAGDAADPAERVARALCGFVRQALIDPGGVRLMLRLFHGASVPNAPMDRGVRADIRSGLACARFGGVSLEAGVLLAVGAIQIAVARALDLGAPDQAERLARELAFALLRGLGLDPRVARNVAAEAAAEIFVARA